MDQVAVAVGSPGALLPILCRPASPWPAVALPPDLEIVGWPSGAVHDVSGAPYRRARAAAFMGKRMVEASEGRSWSWVSELPATAVARLPEEIGGAEFLARWGDTGDPLTLVEPDEAYPVRASSLFGVAEHGRSSVALSALSEGEPARLGPLLRASHAGYEAMGLGHPAVTEIVEAALATPGVLGARASGGGCGGTVVVICARGALDHVEALIR
jgi:galactokinase